MYVRIGYDLEFHLPAATPMLLMLYTHPDVEQYLVQQDYVRTEPALPIHTYIDGFGNRCGRILAPAGNLRIWNDMIVRDSGLPDLTNPSITHQTPVEFLPDETLSYLLGSRYCQVLPLSNIAWQLFGSTGEGWHRVQAVCDWIYENIRFDYLKTNPEKTAWDVWTERVGVCRDFMHLAISFCRCLNIPARYATGYLSDIGEPPTTAPMDFSAYFEVYLGGAWYPFDARNNKARMGRVLMARGRDAVDVALTTAFGEATMTKFVVWTDEVSSPELPAEIPQPANAIYGDPSRIDKL